MLFISLILSALLLLIVNWFAWRLPRCGHDDRLHQHGLHGRAFFPDFFHVRLATRGASGPPAVRRHSRLAHNSSWLLLLPGAFLRGHPGRLRPLGDHGCELRARIRAPPAATPMNPWQTGCRRLEPSRAAPLCFPPPSSGSPDWRREFPIARMAIGNPSSRSCTSTRSRCSLTARGLRPRGCSIPASRAWPWACTGNRFRSNRVPASIRCGRPATSHGYPRLTRPR